MQFLQDTMAKNVGHARKMMSISDQNIESKLNPCFTQQKLSRARGSTGAYASYVYV